MAIEFQCPYCTATIRVADQMGGREGRCPKCETRLIVPQVPLPGAPGKPPTPPVQSVTPASNPAVRPTFDTTVDGMQSHTAFFDPEAKAVPESVEPGPSPILQPPREPPFRVRQMRERSRRRHRILVIGVPVICFLVLFAILAAIMTSRLPELSGQLGAEMLTERSLPRASIGWSQLDLTAAEQTGLAEMLRTSPESFVSTSMTCQLYSVENGIEVELTASGDNAWCVVDPAQQPPLVLWHRRQQAALSAAILQELRTQGTAWGQHKLRDSKEGGSPTDPAVYRDSVGLNAHVRSLGYALEAVAGARVARCAHEDDLGRLYFLLPRGTQGFIIRGRTLPNGEMLFPGEYTVVVASTPNPEGPPETPPQPVGDPGGQAPSPEPAE